MVYCFVDESNMLVNSPFNYTGNKFEILPKLISNLPESTESMTLIDLFSGSGNISFNLAYRFKKILSNEYMGDIQRIQNVIQNGSDEDFENLIKCVKQFSSSDYNMYQKLRDYYNTYMYTDYTNHSEFIRNRYDFLNEKAYRLYGLMLSCTSHTIKFNRNGLFDQTCGKCMYDEFSEKKLISWRNMLKTIHNVDLLVGDFEKSIPEYIENKREILFYANPPYSNTIYGYKELWKSTDEDRLFNFIMKNIDSKWMISGTEVEGDSKCKLLDLILRTGKFKTIYLDYDCKKNGTTTREVILINY